MIKAFLLFWKQSFCEHFRVTYERLEPDNYHSPYDDTISTCKDCGFQQVIYHDRGYYD